MTTATLLLDSNASAKAKAFVQALADLCFEHKVQLSTTGYDGLQMWDIGTSEPLYVPYIEDHTSS